MLIDRVFNKELNKMKLTNEQKNNRDLQKYRLIEMIVHNNTHYSSDSPLIQKTIVQLERMSIDVLTYLAYTTDKIILK